jgi:iron complex transport system substrate-binding protein
MDRVRSLGGLALLACVLVLSACASTTSAGSGASSVTSAASPAFPVTVDAANGTLTLDAAPERIVSLSPTATEMLFAVGAGDQVVAADSYSNYPADAPTTDLSAYEPNVEAIAKYEPDLVVYASDPGDLQSSLDKLKIPALEEPAAATLDDVYGQLRELGVVTGHADAGEQQATQLQDRIDDIQSAAADAGNMTYYYELDDTYYSVTSDTFIGNLLATLGLKNIADQAKGASSGYPQLSAEYIVSADPDLILLADTKCCNQSPEKVAKRAGWDDLTAVQHDAVVPLDDDIASRWGPRIADLLQRVGDAVQQQAAA